MSSRPSRILRPALPDLPHVWRVRDLAPEPAAVPAGHPLLDQALPGGGWPCGSLTEILQGSPGDHVWQLLLPALVRLQQEGPGPIVLVGSPFQPFGPSLAARGLRADRLLCVQADQGKARLWAAEQALRCAQVAAVLAWLPQSRSEELRRLHLAAQQHDRLLFVFRAAKCRHDASPAPLRLLVEGVDQLEVHILKRRGPPLATPVILPAVSTRLAALLEARNARRSAGVPAADPSVPPGRSHVLDRTAAFQ